MTSEKKTLFPNWLIILLGVVLAVGFFLPLRSVTFNRPPFSPQIFDLSPFMNWMSYFSPPVWSVNSTIVILHNPFSLLLDSYAPLFGLVVVITGVWDGISTRVRLRLYVLLCVGFSLITLFLEVRAFLGSSVGIHGFSSFIGTVPFLLVLLLSWWKKYPVSYRWVLARTVAAGIMILQLAPLIIGIISAKWFKAALPSFYSYYFGFYLSGFASIFLTAIFVRQAWEERPLLLTEPEPVR